MAFFCSVRLAYTFSTFFSLFKIYFGHNRFTIFKHMILCFNLGTFEKKPAAQAAPQALPDATPPIGKIYPFTKMAVTFEPMM